MRQLAGKTIDSKEKNVPSTKATLCEEGKTSSILNCYKNYDRIYRTLYTKTNLENTRRNRDKLHNFKTGVNLTSLG